MIIFNAGVAELVDAPDSKFGDGNIVSVRARPSVKSYIITLRHLFVLHRPLATAPQNL
jgi:hypothetical protein